jgi:poly-beta-hydroxyalkanoate depolymerase
MNYYTYELAHTAIAPMRWGANGLKMQLESPFNPFRGLLLPRMVAAGC